jgi:pyruvate dehydrogenase E2 component (dihydrolipoamide acetyltransferase)
VAPPVPAAEVGPPPPAVELATGADRRAGLRRATAKLMTRSNTEVPQYHLVTTVDMSASLTWLARYNEGRPIAERVVAAALLCRATALASARFPTINGFWVDDDLHPAEHVHLGLAVSVRGGGLVTPVIRDADGLAVPQLMVAMREVAERARAGRLRRTELTDATLTVTNLGERGAEAVMGVLFPPQVALVGFGRVVERPWAVGGLLGVRPLVTVTLTADHRASDGHEGSRFLEDLAGRLEHPEDL